MSISKGRYISVKLNKKNIFLFFFTFQNSYYLKNLYLDTGIFPRWMPRAKFLITMILQNPEGKNHIIYLKLRLYGELKKK